MASVTFSLVLSITHINSHEDSMEQLKLELSHELKEHQEKNIVWFQGVNPAQLVYPRKQLPTLYDIFIRTQSLNN